ncbi:MAG: PilZ domain-containing protein [Vulcanimicrobiaceae bacterium]
MFADLIDWFGSRTQEKREAPRTRQPFKVAFSTNGVTWNQATGIDIGVGGISVLSAQGFHKTELDFKLTIERREIPCRVAVIRHEGAIQQGRKLHKYGLRFVSMKKDDQDAVMRWLHGKPLEPVNRAKEELTAVRMAPDDVARLFPKAVQARLHDELINRHRLAPHKHKHEPLVAYYYGGATMVADKRLHRLTIESKVVHHDHTEARFRTRFAFDDNGSEITVLD